MFTERQTETKRCAVATTIGKAAADIFSCDKQIISCVTLRVSFLRNCPNFCLISDDEANDYNIELSQANLYGYVK